MKKQPQTTIRWEEERRTLTLEGEPVLEYILRWPVLEGARGCRRINRYYDRVVQVWRRRWQRGLYWKACLMLADCRSRSRPFRPWGACLEGTVTLQTPELVSLHMEVGETGSDGRTLRTAWGDVWRVSEGAPVPLRQLLPPGCEKRRVLMAALGQAVRETQKQGDYVLDRDVEEKLPRAWNKDRFFAEEETLTFLFPQCSIAPAAEGCPVVRLRRSKEIQQNPGA